MSDRENGSIVLDLNARYKIKEDFVLREIGGEVVIIPVSDQSMIGNGMLSPNDTASFIWKCFTEPSTIPEVVARCTDEYDGDPAEIESAIQTFVYQSLQLNIIEKEDI